MASALTLATTMSRPPSAAAVSATHWRTPSASATSRQRPVTTPPRSVSSTAARATSASVRAQKATEAPSSASVSTMARPMPLVPPVTRARSPFSPRSMCFPPLTRGRGQLAQPPVHALVRVGRGQQALAHLRDRAVVDVHHVGQRALAHLGEQLVGVELVQTVQVAQPAGHAGLPDPPGVLERPARPHHHEVVVGLEPRAGRPAAPYHVHREGAIPSAP